MNGQHNNNRNYSAADLLRYLDGQMDRAELHALERAMLDDEMLADAVEGYRLMRETYPDEAILAKTGEISTPKNTANQQAKQAPVVPLPRFRWIGYAAAACVVVAAGWWIINLSQPGNVLPPEANDRENPSFVNADPSDSAIPAEKGGLPGNTVAAAEVPAPPPPEKENNKVNNTPSGSGEVAVLSNKNADPLKPSPSVLAEQTVPSKTEGSQLADANAKMDSRRISAPAAESSAFPSHTFKIADSTGASPMAGWDYYREYLDSKFNFPPLPKTGTIEINLTAGGKIAEVTVNAPVSDKDKNHIIQSVKSGPPWKNKTGNPAKAVIQFQ